MRFDNNDLEFYLDLGSENLFRMVVVTEENTKPEKAERRVTFRITVDVYYPRPEHYPPSPSPSLEGK